MSTKSEFLDLYLSMAPRNLIPYIEAWGWQTRGYWDPSVSSWLIVPSAYLGNDAQSFLPSIDNAYNSDMKHFATLAYPLFIGWHAHVGAAFHAALPGLSSRTVAAPLALSCAYWNYAHSRSRLV